jgi:hypothetical protein
MKLLVTTVLIVLLTSSARSQQPYAGLQNRSIKTLSDQQIADLNAGRGMGLALAAELNGYPGPIHAIELAEQLRLSPDQVDKLKSLFEAMKAETIPLGAIAHFGGTQSERGFCEPHGYALELERNNGKDRDDASRFARGPFEVPFIDRRDTHRRSSDAI